MNTKEIELLPCPFCGGSAVFRPPTAKIYDEYNPTDRFFPIVNCSSCWAQVWGEDHDWSCKSAISRWNKRQ